MRALREEQVLADLIQHPQYLHDVVDWLEPEVFTTLDRRQIFEAIVAVDRYGEPVEELTLAWELARVRAGEATQALDTDPRTQTRAAETAQAPGQLARLTVLTVEPGASIEVGRDLLAEQVHSELTATTAKLSAGVGHTTIGHTTVEHEHQLRRSVTSETTAAPLVEPPPNHQLGIDNREMRQQ